MNWKSVEDELPPIGKHVVVWSENNSPNPFDHMDTDWLEYFIDEFPKRGSSFAENNGPVTHWMDEDDFELPEGVVLTKIYEEAIP